MKSLASYLHLQFLISTFFFIGITMSSYSQITELNSDPEPIGGVEKLSLVYYKIDFSKEQKSLLEGKEIEFIYSVDKDGIATLEKIHGIRDMDILDSLVSASRHLPLFQPRIENGRPVSSIYFLKMTFPTYKTDPYYLDPSFILRNAEYEDFEYIHTSGARMDILIGGAFNAYLGPVSDHLGLGGGFRLDMAYIGQKGWGGSLLMNFYGNRLKKDFSVNSTREQSNAPPTLLLGLGLVKVLNENEKTEFNVHFDACVAFMNVITRDNPDDEDYVQFIGFSPGIVANYSVQFSKNKVGNYYGSPTLINHHINFHGALRPEFFDHKEANGIMIEFGISYLMKNHTIKEFKLKPGNYRY